MQNEENEMQNEENEALEDIDKIIAESLMSLIGMQDDNKTSDVQVPTTPTPVKMQDDHGTSDVQVLSTPTPPQDLAVAGDKSCDQNYQDYFDEMKGDHDTCDVQVAPTQTPAKTKDRKKHKSRGGGEKKDGKVREHRHRDRRHDADSRRNRQSDSYQNDGLDQISQDDLDGMQDDYDTFDFQVSPPQTPARKKDQRKHKRLEGGEEKDGRTREHRHRDRRHGDGDDYRKHRRRDSYRYNEC